MKAIASVIAVLVLANGPALGQQPQSFRLKEVVSAGDVGTIVSSFDISVDARAQVLDQESPAMRTRNLQEASYTVTVLSADAKGNPTGAKLRFTRAKMMMQLPGRRGVTRTSPAQGKTVTIKKIGGKTTVSIDRGKLTAQDRAQLQEALDDDWSTVFPDYEVAIGEEWSIDSGVFARKALGSDATATVTGQVLDVVQKQGRPCARARLTMEISGRPQGEPLDMSIKLSGELYFATDIKRVLVVNLSGPVTISGEIVQGGASLAIHGQGTSRLYYNSKWNKIAGRPQKK